MDEVSPKKGSKLVTIALVVATIGILVAGSMMAETQISSYKAGYLLGGILKYAAIATVVLGLILRSVRIPHPWAASSCAVSLISALILIWQAHAQARTDDQQTMALAIEHSLMYQLATDDVIVMDEYPESTYGSFATPLTIVNRVFMDFQRKKLDLDVKLKAVGPLDFDFPGTFIDAAKRSEAMNKLATVKEITSQTKKNAHDFNDAIRSDVEASDMSAADKRDFLNGFGKGQQRFVDQVNSYCDLVQEIDGLSEDMLNVASADVPRLVKGRLTFAKAEDTRRFQEDAEKKSAAAEELSRMQSAMSQSLQDAAPYLRK